MVKPGGYRRNAIKRYGPLFPLLLCCLGFIGCTSGKQPTKKSKPTPQVVAHTILSSEQMKEDLDYTVKVLRNVHPATYRGFSEQHQVVIDAAYQRIQEPAAAEEFFFIVNSVVCSLLDGHTYLHSITHKQNRRIDVPIIWLHEGFYVEEHREPFQQGDRIIAIGGKSIETIYQQMRTLIPAENEHYRKWKMAQNIQREEFLDYLAVIKNEAVEIRVERDSSEITIVASLKPASQHKHSQPKRPWVGYQFDTDLSLGIFHLDKCNPNDHYKKTVRAFFTKVRKHDIRYIAIDVRRNGGGNSNVVNEFLRYMNIDQYKGYSGDIRYSKEVAQVVGYNKTSGYRRGKPNTIQNNQVKDSDHLFDGSLFVLTSHKTFSSGNWFAVIVKDNKIGTIIGEPTGNAPSSYGDIPSFQMPHTGFGFSVSHKKFVRPTPDNDPEDALYPDILVYTTIDDIIKGTDPQLEKLRAIIKEKSM